MILSELTIALHFKYESMASIIYDILNFNELTQYNGYNQVHGIHVSRNTYTVHV